MSSLQILPIENLPVVGEGDRIADVVSDRVRLEDGDVLALAFDFLAKAEGQTALVNWHDATEREQLIDSQTERVLRKTNSGVITETVHGFVCADAGIRPLDSSASVVALLPRDADRSAFKIRERLKATRSIDVAVLVTASFIRPWRNGLVGVALGSSGLLPFRPEDEGCIIDELAAAASLVLRNDRSVSAAIIRGVDSRWLGMQDGDVRDTVVQKPTEALFR